MPQSKIRRYLRHGTLPQLAVFEAVARLGSFTRAGEELYMAQPTVSVQIKKLTETIGAPLLEQVGKTVRLTSVGRELQAASSEIDRAMKSFYVPSDQEVDYLLEIVSTASQYSSAVYESEALFLRGLHARTLPQCPILPRCLSALAGAGKSALFLAVERVMPVVEMIALPLAIAHEFPMRSCQRIVVDAASTMRELLDPMLPSDLRVQQDESLGSLQAAKKRSRATTGDLHLAASRRCFSMGVASLMLDETQFASHSPAAGARAVSWVLTFGRLPPPFLFAVNYDLLKKLLDRPDYDKDRILADPKILMPEPPRSDGMSKYLTECQVVLAEVLGFRLAEEPDLIFSLTANVRRKVARILVLAYEAMRAAKAKTIMPEHLRAAYGSLKYSAMRSDVTAILTQSVLPPGSRCSERTTVVRFQTVPSKSASKVTSMVPLIWVAARDFAASKADIGLPVISPITTSDSTKSRRISPSSSGRTTVQRCP